MRSSSRMSQNNANSEDDLRQQAARRSPDGAGQLREYLTGMLESEIERSKKNRSRICAFAIVAQSGRSKTDQRSSTVILKSSEAL